MLSTLNILLISANAHDRDICELLLYRVKDAKYKLTWVECSETALEVVKTEQPDCILLDNLMPKANGKTLLEYFNINHSNLPVIMLTEQEDEELATQLLDDGVFDYIPKPMLSGAILHRIIQSALGDELSLTNEKETKFKKYKILVIDDSDIDREVCVRAFKKVKNASYQVFERASGNEGLAYINEHKPDCVLLDYYMPGRNGIETLKHIKAKHPFLPVIMLTGQEDASLAVQVMKFGAQDYIAKADVNPETLSRSVRLAVARCSLEQENDLNREAINTFGRALAHDLKEPVRMIRSFLKIIEETQDLTEQNKEYFSHVIGATNSMDNLIDMVHQYTKLDITSTANKKDVAFSQAARAAEANLRRILPEKALSIEVDENLSVSGNFAQITQVFQNLIMNAVLHNDKEKPIIKVSSETNDLAHIIHISDNGPGIETAYHYRIFEPFTRFSDGKKGSGLGLAICKKTIEYIGGEIWVENSDLGGCVFKFTIPHSLEAQEDVFEEIEEGSVGAVQPEKPASLVNILLVEDDDLDIKLAQILLFERDGLSCNLFTAKNGKEALSFLSDEDGPKIDLVLLDINMPVMDGFEFLQNIRANSSTYKLPIIMCTTSNYHRDVERAKSFDVIDYINKPITLDKMRPSIENVEKFFFQETNGHIELLKH